MKHKLINFNWIINNVIVPTLLINYLNLIKKSIQKQLLTEQMFFEIDFLKVSQYSELKICVGVSRFFQNFL